MNKIKLILAMFICSISFSLYGADISVQEDGGGNFDNLEEACDNVTVDPTTITISGEWDNIDTGTSCLVADDNVTIIATGAARVTTASHVLGSPKHYRLHVSDGDTAAIQVNNDGCTIDGIEIKQNAAGASDEGIRMANNGGTLTVTNCILWSTKSGSDQDGIYAGVIDCTINGENVIVYNFLRAGFHSQSQSGTHTQTWNINSSIAYACGQNSEVAAGGITVNRADVNSTINTNIHNTWVIDCNFDTNDDYNEEGSSATAPWNIHNSIDSDNSIASRDAGGFENQASNTISDSTGGNTVVFVEDITGAPFNLAINSTADSNAGGDATTCSAFDEHDSDSGAGLTIPATDIDGTSRPQNTNHDVGAFELIAAGAAPTFIPKIIWFN